MMSYTVNSSEVKKGLYEKTISQSRVQADDGATGEQWRETCALPQWLDLSHFW